MNIHGLLPMWNNSQVVVVRAELRHTKLSLTLLEKLLLYRLDSSALAAFTGEDAEEANRALAASFQSLQQVSDYEQCVYESGIRFSRCGLHGYRCRKVRTEARGSKYVMLNEHVSSEQYGIGFKKGNTELRNQVQEALNEMLADGTFNEIAQKWKLEESVCLGQSGADEVLLAENGQTQKKNSVAQLGEIIVQLKNGMFATLGIFILTLVFSLPLGLVITFIRMSKVKLLQWIAKIYISIMQWYAVDAALLVVFFGPYYLFGISLSYSYRFYAVIIGFA